MISAAEALEISKEYQSEIFKREMKTLPDLIKTASEHGRQNLDLMELSPNAAKELTRAGYSITSIGDPATFRISWGPCRKQGKTIKI